MPGATDVLDRARGQDEPDSGGILSEQRSQIAGGVKARYFHRKLLFHTGLHAALRYRRNGGMSDPFLMGVSFSATKNPPPVRGMRHERRENGQQERLVSGDSAC